MKQTDDLDGILNDALAEYREAEPLPGIEERVLRRLQAHVPSMPRLGWAWRLAVATIAVVGTLVWTGVRHAYQHRSSRPQWVQQNAPAAPASHKIAVISSDEARSMAEGPVRRRTAKASTQQQATLAVSRPARVQSQFPTPVALDQEERALFALARNAPEALRPFLRDENSTTDISPITIPPLEHSSGTEGED